MRCGTGCCTSFIPGQVALWCRTRVPDRLSLQTHAGVGLGSRRTRVATCLHAGRREAPITRPGASGMLITGRPFRGCRLDRSMGPAHTPHSTLPAHTASSHCRLALPAHTASSHCQLHTAGSHCQLTLHTASSHCQLTLPTHTAGSHSTLPAHTPHFTLSAHTAACVRLVLFQLRVRSATGSAAAHRRAAVADLSTRTGRAATVARCLPPHAPSLQCAQPRASADSAMQWQTGARILPVGQVRDYSR
jgi:hypothetical protein